MSSPASRHCRRWSAAVRRRSTHSGPNCRSSAWRIAAARPGLRPPVETVISRSPRRTSATLWKSHRSGASSTFTGTRWARAIRASSTCLGARDAGDPQHMQRGDLVRPGQVREGLGTARPRRCLVGEHGDIRRAAGLQQAQPAQAGRAAGGEADAQPGRIDGEGNHGHSRAFWQLEKMIFLSGSRMRRKKDDLSISSAGMRGLYSKSGAIEGRRCGAWRVHRAGPRAPGTAAAFLAVRVRVQPSACPGDGLRNHVGAMHRGVMVGSIHS